MNRTLLPFLLLVAQTAGALTVTVDPAGGAPRIVVDGKPVRARMFWGGPGASPLPVGTGGESDQLRLCRADHLLPRNDAFPVRKHAGRGRSGRDRGTGPRQ